LFVSPFAEIQERKIYSRRKVSSNAYRYELEEASAAGGEGGVDAERSRAPSLKELLENAGEWFCTAPPPHLHVGVAARALTLCLLRFGVSDGDGAMACTCSEQGPFIPLSVQGGA
jgi:hypothetical protein